MQNRVIYYRLNSIDLDGTSEYSNTVYISMSKDLASAGVNVFPNPAAEALNIDFGNQFSGDILLRIYDQVGKLQLEKKADVSDAGSVNVADLRTGIYQVVMQEERSGTQVSGKFIKK
jgi:hypothetical protein